MLGALLWLAGQGVALRWLARTAARMSAGRLVLRGVRGSLYGPIDIRYLSLATGHYRIVARDVEADWLPRALLLQGVLRIDRLRVRGLDLWPIGAPSRASEPASLKLPLALTLTGGRIGRMTYHARARAVAFGPLRFSFSGSAAQNQLRLAAADTPWGAVSGGLAIGADAPYALSGAWRVVAATPPHPHTLQGRVSGTLAQIDLVAHGAMGHATASAAARLTPFGRIGPIASARVRIRHVDPRALVARAPQADLDVLVGFVVRPNGQAAGFASVANALPGPVDEHRLPLVRLSARFAGTRAHWVLAPISADFGRAGAFEGSGVFERGRLAVRLSTSAFNLRAVDQSLKSTRLSGTVWAQATTRRQEVRATLTQSRYAFRLHAVHTAEALIVRKAQAAAEGSTATAHGRVDLSGARAFQLSGQLKRFDPAHFGRFPAGDINALFSAAGHLGHAWAATGRFQLRQSRLRGRPLSGHGRLQVREGAALGARVALRVGRDRLEADGSVGIPASRLTWRLDAPRLGDIDPRMRGGLTGTGVVEGPLASPSGRLELSGNHLAWGNRYRVGELRLDGAMAHGLAGTASLRLVMSQVRVPRLQAERVSLRARGEARRQVLEAVAAGDGFDWTVRAAGSWAGMRGWRGSIERLTNRGPNPVTLTAPASLAVGPGYFRLTHADLRVGGGRLVIRRLSRERGVLATSGELAGVSTTFLTRFVSAPGYRSSLTVSGNWSLTAARTVNGHLAVHRDQGDITVLTAHPLALGLTTLGAQVAVRDDRIRARLEAAGRHLGAVHAAVGTMLSRRNGAWGVAPSAPFDARIAMNVQSIAWADALMPDDVSINGALALRAQGQGRVGRPAWTGRFQGERLAISVPDAGVRLKDGVLQGTLQGRTMALEKVAFQGPTGTLTGTGRIAWAKSLSLDLALSAHDLEVLSRPDRSLTVTGSLATSLAPAGLTVKGHLTANKARIEWMPRQGPVLSADVVVLGRLPKPVKKERLPTVFDVRFDLGPDFRFTGLGAAVQLAGVIAVQGHKAALPGGYGLIRVVKGTYSAYGQSLTITRGFITFAGPLDDPALNLVAMRLPHTAQARFGVTPTVEAGVSVTGTALAPRVQLVSVPDVPDTEKLSWLVLGHGLEGVTSGDEFAALQAAAGAFSSGSASSSLQARIAHALGLSSVGIKSGTGGLAGSLVTLGKRISSRAYVTYERGLTGAENIVKIRYILSRRWSVQAETGSASGLDLFYTLLFH
ncbi:MAG: translocation/assembly module TamB domain-containing protein [Betaproteobacteria bacterium]|nr:translocation/assembly module TamB domain-containing protein [Betaproteobacteria bacterium]